MERPSENEYASYYQKYVSLIADNIVSALNHQLEEMQNIFSSLNEETGNYAYDTGKWTIKELLGHVIDTERVFSYRIMCIARGEKQSMPGMDQNDYVNGTDFNSRSLPSLEEEYKHLRLANIALVKSLKEEELNKKGTASNNPVTVRALVFILAGHEKHHLNILKERYNSVFTK
ncbi:MAG: DinB family protein [Ignavibacteriaceae bacterium]